MQATASQGTESKKTARGGKPHDPRRQNCDERRKVDHLNNTTSAYHNNGSLKCFYTNASSLFNKLDEIKHRTDQYDIIAITETWATDDMADGELSIEGFSMIRSDRKGGIGGGVLLYVKSSIPV